MVSILPLLQTLLLDSSYLIVPTWWTALHLWQSCSLPSPRRVRTSKSEDWSDPFKHGEASASRRYQQRYICESAQATQRPETAMHTYNLWQEGDGNPYLMLRVSVWLDQRALGCLPRLTKTVTDFGLRIAQYPYLSSGATSLRLGPSFSYNNVFVLIQNTTHDRSTQLAGCLLAAASVLFHRMPACQCLKQLKNYLRTYLSLKRPWNK